MNAPLPQPQIPSTPVRSMNPIWALAGLVLVALSGTRWARSGDPGPAAVVPAMPVGSIVAFGGAASAVVESQGWMLCDGRELPASSYPQLNAAIGKAWGGNSSGGTFRLPDLRGRFLRGVNYDGDGPMRDPDRAARVASAPGGNEGNEVGSLQEDGVGPHIHPLSGVGDATGPGYAGQFVRFFASKVPDETAAPVRSDFAVQANAGGETRPKNVGVNYIIRVK